MKYQLLKAKENLLSNYWLIPIVITVMFMMLAVLLFNIDLHYNLKFNDMTTIIFQGDTAKLVLSTIATSIITVTGVVFSITVLILSIASNQLGPRLIPNFIQQGKTQFVLGILIGTFVYCLMILSVIENQSSPMLSLAFGVFMGIGAFLVLIYFINHICQAIQIENVLNKLTAQIKRTIKREYLTEKKEESVDMQRALQKCSALKKTTLYTKKNGFIQYIDYAQLFQLADQYGVVVRVLYKPGNYLITGLPYLEIYSQDSQFDKLTDQVDYHIRISDHRTDVQDIEYLFEQISEIAVRALSPGINNPYSAILCLNVIAECLAKLNQYYIPTEVWLNDHQQIRLLVKHSTFDGIIDTVFDRLRQEAKDDVSVTIKMIQMIRQLSQLDLKPEIRQALKKHAGLIYDDSMATKINGLDREDIRCHYNVIVGFQK